MLRNEAFQARPGGLTVFVENRKLGRAQDAIWPELHGWEGVLKQGEIVSSYYKSRYKVHERYRPGRFTPSTAKTAKVEGEGSNER